MPRGLVRRRTVMGQVLNRGGKSRALVCQRLRPRMDEPTCEVFRRNGEIAAVPVLRLVRGVQERGELLRIHAQLAGEENAGGAQRQAKGAVAGGQVGSPPVGMLRFQCLPLLVFRDDPLSEELGDGA